MFGKCLRGGFRLRELHFRISSSGHNSFSWKTPVFRILFLEIFRFRTGNRLLRMHLRGVNFLSESKPSSGDASSCPGRNSICLRGAIHLR